MAKCKIVHCGKNYLGHVTKICAVCWDNFEVCPSCLLKYGKAICSACIEQGILDDSIDVLKAGMDKG